MVTDQLENPVKAAGASSWRPRARWQIRSKLCFSKCPPRTRASGRILTVCPFWWGPDWWQAKLAKRSSRSTGIGSTGTVFSGTE